MSWWAPLFLYGWNVLGATAKPLLSAAQAGCIIVEKAMWNQRLFQRLAAQVGLPLEMRETPLSHGTTRTVLWPLKESTFPIRISTQKSCTASLATTAEEHGLLLYLPDDDLLANHAVVQLLLSAAKAHTGCSTGGHPWLGWGSRSFELGTVLSRLSHHQAQALQVVRALLAAPTHALSDGHTLLVQGCIEANSQSLAKLDELAQKGFVVVRRARNFLHVRAVLTPNEKTGELWRGLAYTTQPFSFLTETSDEVTLHAAS